MPSFLLHDGAGVVCLHTGRAQPTLPDQRVTVSGEAVVTQPTSYTVTGCTLPAPPAANGPCATAQWVTAAKRVRASGLPALLADSQAVCAPSGTGVNVVATQTRVSAA